MGKQPARQRQQQQQQPQQQPQQQQQQQQEQDADAKLARTKRLVLQTSLMVAAALVAAYFGLISDKLALGIMVGMSLVVRFMA
jgi:Na+/glutamate symporter